MHTSYLSFFYKTAIWGQRIYTLKCVIWRQKLPCDKILFTLYKAVFPRSDWKTLGKFFTQPVVVMVVTNIRCVVMYKQHRMSMRSSNHHLNPNLNDHQWLWSRKTLQRRVWLFRLLKNILTRTRGQRLERECLEYLLKKLEKYLNKSTQSTLNSLGTNKSIPNFQRHSPVKFQ